MCTSNPDLKFHLKCTKICNQSDSNSRFAQLNIPTNGIIAIQEFRIQSKLFLLRHENLTQNKYNSWDQEFLFNNIFIRKTFYRKNIHLPVVERILHVTAPRPAFFVSTLMWYSSFWARHCWIPSLILQFSALPVETLCTFTGLLGTSFPPYFTFTLYLPQSSGK